MPKCELSGKSVVSKNLVSHSNIKTKSRAFANVQNKRFFSEQLKRFVRLKVATSTLRNISKQGSFDAYLMKQPDKNLSVFAKGLKNRMLGKITKGQKLSKITKKVKAKTNA